MAITAQNCTYLYGGPVAEGQVLLQPHLTGKLSGLMHGIAEFTGDGTATTAVVNYIDGTKKIGASPSAIIGNVIGGDDTAGADVKKIVDNADKVGFTVTFSAAPATGKKVRIAFVIYP